METRASVQERYAPENHCFGCGPANPKGLRLRSHEAEAGLVARWHASPEHEAFDGVVNGGIIGALLDCHGNWAAALHLMKASGRDTPPCTVTSEFHVRLLRVTPSDRELHLEAHVVEAAEDRATVEASLAADGQVTARCRGVFVAVREGHAAYRRW